MKTLQEYWAITVIFIRIFSQCTLMFRLKEFFSVFRNFFDQRKLFYRRLYFLTLQRTRVNYYFCSIEFGYHFSCN